MQRRMCRWKRAARVCVRVFAYVDAARRFGSRIQSAVALLCERERQWQPDGRPIGGKAERRKEFTAETFGRVSMAVWQTKQSKGMTFRVAPWRHTNRECTRVLLFFLVFVFFVLFFVFRVSRRERFSLSIATVHVVKGRLGINNPGAVVGSFSFPCFAGQFFSRAAARFATSSRNSRSSFDRRLIASNIGTQSGPIRSFNNDLRARFVFCYPEAFSIFVLVSPLSFRECRKTN